MVATAIPKCTNPDDVSVIVKAFISADLPIWLIELLGRIFLEPSPFNENKNLQNLLMLTAIRSDKGKVVNYVKILERYNVNEITEIAIDHGLYEEAFTVYKKYDKHANAISVLVEHVVSIDRGLDCATKANGLRCGAILLKLDLLGCGSRTVSVSFSWVVEVGS